jgi:ribosomal protein S18 acetylase RimI-like enzyme
MTLAAIRALTGRDAPLLADIITDAFRDDPLMTWTFGEAGSARSSYAAIARSIWERAGFGHVAADGSGGALWLPPGASSAPDGVGGELAALAIAARIFLAGGVRALSRAEEASRAMLSHRPDEPDYYLYAIGVRPGGRRRGLGSALMAGALARCDAEHAPAHLESSNAANLGFYRRLGFEVTRRLAITPGGPHVWLMRREPRHSAAQRAEARPRRSEGV